MADVLDIENQDEFEFEEDGDRNKISNFYHLKCPLFASAVDRLLPIPFTSKLTHMLSIV